MKRFIPSIAFGSACWYAAGIVAGLCLAGCSTLGKAIQLTDPETGETVTTTVGDALADSVTAASGPVSSILANIIGAASANPVLGAGAGAALLAAVAAGAAKLRPKK